jgi:Na+(H+)/acetate symporter ActP
LTVSVAGVLAQDVLGRTGWSGVRAFRVGTVLSLVVPLLVATAGASIGLANSVGLAFAVAASSFAPLLLLGIWWPRLTAPGALAGMAVGGGLAVLAVAATVATGGGDGLTGALLAQPAAWTMPAAVVTMICVSLATSGSIPASVARTMVRLHAPEAVDVDRGSWSPRREGRRP